MFPGGDFEVFRPWSERNEIEFGDHKGFVQLALATGIRVVPMTIHGAHQSTIVITRGRRIARATGLNRLHVKEVARRPFGGTTTIGRLREPVDSTNAAASVASARPARRPRSRSVRLLLRKLSTSPLTDFAVGTRRPDSGER